MVHGVHQYHGVVLWVVPCTEGIIHRVTPWGSTVGGAVCRVTGSTHAVGT